jgi:peptidoglycan/xylan/chitin deacetylase (PgdA/CDA1 family)
VKTLAKKVLCGVEAGSGLEWLRDKIAPGPAVVLCFHRVSDSIPEDAISISTNRFQWILDELKDNYRVIPFSQLITELESEAEFQRRTIAITFDDGYLDNHAVAAPMLAEAGLPATFFVAAGLIGTHIELPWDAHVKGRVSWMDWNHVRELHKMGFEIGSHTLSHCDLGKTTGEEARREIFDSRSVLENKLGASVPMFAFPFGGQRNITAENVELVRRAGYRSCCSAHGGFVWPRSSSFDIHRIPINSYFKTPAEFHFEARRLKPLYWAPQK